MKKLKDETTEVVVTAEAQTPAVTDETAVAPILSCVGVTAVCKHCHEQIKLAALSLEEQNQMRNAEAVRANFAMWEHANTREQQCRARNNRPMLTSAEPLEGSISAGETAEPAKSEVVAPDRSLFAAWAEPLAAVLYLMRAWMKWFREHYRTARMKTAVARAVVDECAKCPGCGIFAKHPIKFVDALGKVLHNCQRCSACWAEDPIAQFDAWKIAPMSTEPELRKPFGDRASGVSRHPSLVEK